jgi:glycosyltransferase involved in cell wall biosynthesis
VSRGVAISASVTEFAPLHPRILDLQAHGVDLWLRPTWYSWREHPWRRFRSRRVGATVHAVEELLRARSPALVVLSDGVSLPPIELLELCSAHRLPYVTIVHLGRDRDWWDDGRAERYRIALAAARRCYFISDVNRRLSEKQIGGELPNAEVIWNPLNVSCRAPLSWPPLSDSGELRLACVGRLYLPHKGQDLLFEALASPIWRERPWRLYLYGEGPMRGSLEWLARTLHIADRVVFAGFANVDQIWAENHVLVVPSRFEGGPMVTVEAMSYGRPVIGTPVGFHPEVIEDGVTGFLADAPTASSIAVALERFWQRRGEAEEIGKAGARRISQLVPPDPVRVFSDKLTELIEPASDGVAFRRPETIAAS